MISLLTLPLFIVVIAGYYEINRPLLGNIIDILIAVGLLTSLVSSVLAIKNGDYIARFYLFSFLGLFVGVLSWIGMNQGIFSVNLFTRYGLLWGNLLQLLTLSLGMAYQLHILDEKIKITYYIKKEKKHYQQLVRMISHDLSNSLFVIKSYADKLFKMSDHTFPDKNKPIKKILFATQNAQMILTQIKEDEFLRKNKETINLEATDLSKSLNNVKEIIDYRLEEKNLKLEITINEEIKDILAIPIALTNQVILNLLTNAIKFSPVDSVIKINVIEIENNKVNIHIIDSGAGIPKNIQTQIRLQNFKETTFGSEGEKGTGFGLAIVWNYVSLFNGEINFISTNEGEETGTEFIITLNCA